MYDNSVIVRNTADRVATNNNISEHNVDSPGLVDVQYLTKKSVHVQHGGCQPKKPTPVRKWIKYPKAGTGWFQFYSKVGCENMM